MTQKGVLGMLRVNKTVLLGCAAMTAAVCSATAAHASGRPILRDPEVAVIVEPKSHNHGVDQHGAGGSGANGSGVAGPGGGSGGGPGGGSGGGFGAGGGAQAGNAGSQIAGFGIAQGGGANDNVTGQFSNQLSNTSQVANSTSIGLSNAASNTLSNGSNSTFSATSGASTSTSNSALDNVGNASSSLTDSGNSSLSNTGNSTNTNTASNDASGNSTNNIDVGSGGAGGAGGLGGAGGAGGSVDGAGNSTNDLNNAASNNNSTTLNGGDTNVQAIALDYDAIDLATLPVAVCQGSSVTASGSGNDGLFGIGLGFGKSNVDEQCTLRENIRSVATLAEYIPSLRGDLVKAVAHLDGFEHMWPQEQHPKCPQWIKRGSKKARRHNCQLPLMGPMAAPAPAPARLAAQDYLVLFDFDQSTITPQGQQIINQAANTIIQNGVTSVQIDAHADRSGSIAYNEGLAARRAEAVKTALLNAGVPGDLVMTTSFGERDPRILTGDGVADLLNRRARVRITFDCSDNGSC